MPLKKFLMHLGKIDWNVTLKNTAKFKDIRHVQYFEYNGEI